jgi:hypothetical protein
MTPRTIHRMGETRIVEVTGALTGRYEVLEQADDGTVLLGPDTSIEAIRHGLAPRRSAKRSSSSSSAISPPALPDRPRPMSPDPNRLWPVQFDLGVWETDVRASSAAAREHAHRWRTRVELAGGLRERDLKLTRAEDDLLIETRTSGRTAFS